jgi:hypothetical protein
MALVSDLRRSGSMALAFAFAVFCVVAAPVKAQGQATPAASTSASAPASANATAQPPATDRTPSAKHPRHGHAAKVESSQAVVEAPHPPPPPDWPVNDQAKQASVDWNGRNLSIAATNASLQQILRDVSTATGVKVEGQAADERIYGRFGPAPAREVLSQLLDGSGYNVLMVGDKGEGTPRELVLTARAHATGVAAVGTEAHATQNADDDAPEEPEPVEQPSPGAHRPFGIPPGQPGQGRNPEQVIQEMQQRQQQLIQQQQQQPQQPQQPEPPQQQSPQPPND